MSDITLTINHNALNELLSDVEKRLDKAAQFVENAAKENCPVKTGILRASIHHTDVENLETTIGTDVEYAIPVHEGHGKYSGNKFLEDALYTNTDTITRILGGE